MTAWTDDELRRIGEADELGLASRRADETLRPAITIWAVRVGEGIFVRSAYGSDNPWFRRAKASGHGRIEAGGVEKDVTFISADVPTEPGGVAVDQDIVDAAYHAKYDRYGPQIVGSVVGPAVHDLTLRLVPESVD